MFSPREREYLAFLVRSSRERPAGPRGLFSPAYRRKLQWSIRRKASRAVADWELLAAAARAETKLIPRPAEPDRSEVPVHAEPIAAAVRYLHQKIRRGRGGPRSPGAR